MANTYRQALLWNAFHQVLKAVGETKANDRTELYHPFELFKWHYFILMQLLKPGKENFDVQYYNITIMIAQP